MRGDGLLLEQVGLTLSRPIVASLKIAKTLLWSAFPSRIHLLASSWCCGNILYKNKGTDQR